LNGKWEWNFIGESRGRRKFRFEGDRVKKCVETGALMRDNEGK
jgi:hypothetical protein